MENNTENSTQNAQNLGAQAPESEAKQAPYEMEYPVEINIKTMMDAGAHFGHQADRWNPKMLSNIYTKRNGIYIINLDKTSEQWKRARDSLVRMSSMGSQFLFVGTKLQAREIIKHEAQRSGSFHVSTRWLGGTLSNFQTIKNSIERMRKLEDLLIQSSQEGTKIRLSKKERLFLAKELTKLEASLGGIREMRKLPDALFIVDIVKEDIAIKEARRLRIPVFAMVDTNANPNLIDYPISANDDAARTVRLFTAAVADAIIEGKKAFESRVQSSQFSRKVSAPEAQPATVEASA
jgi:small subunit ribosomal protein S2